MALQQAYVLEDRLVVICIQTRICSIYDRLFYTWNSIEFFCVTQYKSYLLSLFKNLSVRHGSHQKTKAYKVSSEMHKVWKLHAMSSMIQTCQNNLDFSLYIILSVCCMITTSDEWLKSEMKVSADLVYHHWTPEIEFNRSYLHQSSD